MSKNSILFVNVMHLWSVPIEVLDASWPGRLTPEEEPHVPIGYETVWAPKLVGTLCGREETMIVSGSESRSWSPQSKTLLTELSYIY
jgi:hypothetical protein